MAGGPLPCRVGICGRVHLMVRSHGSHGCGHDVFLVLRPAVPAGAGGSIAYPSYSKILANHFPEYHRGLGNAVIDAASKLGPAIGTLMGAYLMERYGWRPFFVFLGLASLIWLIPW